MKWSLLATLLIFSANGYIHAAAPSASADASLSTILNFEVEQPSASPTGWGGGPDGTNFVDTTVVHAGKSAARIERTPESEGRFSTLTRSMPVDFTGSRVELRGWVRTEAVTEAAGLWLRQDGSTGMLEFDNMRARQLRGTTDWTEYSISLPLNIAARKLFFGFLVAGSGKAWVDDLELVDGRPVWEAPKIAWAETVFDRNREFDAGSKLNLRALLPGQIENLATLARVWGFLKYHHPKVTRGELHWDYELFRVLPAILAAPDQSAANVLLADWIDRLGPLEFGVRSSPPEDKIALISELRWIEDETRLGHALSSRLRSVRSTRFSGQFYVSLNKGVGNPSFENEPDYARIQKRDAGYQLLGLFRFWNIIRYWFPYRDLIEEDWNAVLTEFIPRIALAESPDAYRLELMALIAKVSDTHANLWDSLHLRPPVGESELPIVLRFIEGEAVVTDVLPTSEFDPAALQRGDIITAIDGVTVKALVRQWSPYYATSNQPTRLRDIARFMTRGPNRPVKLQVRRDGADLELTTARVASSSLGQTKRWHDLPGLTFRLLSPDVAYLKLSSVKVADVPDYVRKATGTKGWIIDARNYPAEFVVFALGSKFVDHGTAFARFTLGNLETPGYFSFTDSLRLSPEAPSETPPRLSDPSAVIAERRHVLPTDFPSWTPQSRAAYPGKVVVLVDELTQSAAEYTTMAFRAAGALVVGSTTAGADGNVSSISLPGGHRTMISGIGVFYPDKRPTQRIGIVPDIEVKPTLAGLRAGRDEVLEESLRQILGAATPPDEINRLASPIEKRASNSLF